MKLFTYVFFMTLIVSCGKDNNSGTASSRSTNQPVTASSPYNQTNPFFENPTLQNQTALQNLTAWYNSPAEIPPTIGPKTEKRVAVGLSANSCNTKTYLGFIDINTCKSSNQSTTNLPDRTVNVILSNTKSANSKLAAVFTPTGGGTLKTITEEASKVYASGKLYTLEYVKPNGHILQYKVDTGLNSAFNPVSIYDSEQSKGEYVSNPMQLL